MGSKRRIKKYILPIILKDRKPGQWYVEPFVGGANIIEDVENPRIASDYNKYLIAALRIIKDSPELIPDLITEEDYENIRKSDEVSDGLKGYVGFAMSFGGKWFGGYRRDVAGTRGDLANMEAQSRRSKKAAVSQSKKLKGVAMFCASYNAVPLPKKSIIYCDPPYANTTKYKTGAFDHEAFWQWCRDRVTDGHKVFVSEYTAPDDFVAVWQMELVSSLTKDTGAKKGVEKLFVHKSQL